MNPRRLDLDAKRLARQHAVPTQLRLGGKDFTLPAELPLEVGELANANDLMGVMKLLIPADQWDDFLAARPTMNDVLDIVGHYTDELGESAASIASSAATGQLSRQTSAGSTVST